MFFNQVAKGLHVALPPPLKMGGDFSGLVGVCLFLWTVGGPLHGGGVGSSQFLTQLANAGPKSVKVNLPNSHRKVCKIKFSQIVTSDVLTSLWQFDKVLFDNLGHVFMHWVHY